MLHICGGECTYCAADDESGPHDIMTGGDKMDRFLNPLWTIGAALVALLAMAAGCGGSDPTATRSPDRSGPTGAPTEAMMEPTEMGAPGTVVVREEGFNTIGGSATVNDDAYDLTFFKNYGVNPFIDTEDDHLSTFAMDVDTASYTVARRFVQDGNLPDPDSVRVEEFVNFFDQEYEGRRRTPSPFTWRVPLRPLA